jgi:hypothetical protein
MISLQFNYGLQCGWSAFDDSLQINRDSVHMRINRLTSSSGRVRIDTAFATPPGVWQALSDSLIWQDFAALSIQTFNLAFDGCDYSLRIKRDSLSHYIRFGVSDTLPSIKPLLNQLDSTWAQFGPWP